MTVCYSALIVFQPYLVIGVIGQKFITQEKIKAKNCPWIKGGVYGSQITPAAGCIMIAKSAGGIYRYNGAGWQIAKRMG